MKTKGSLLWSHKPVLGSYPESFEPSPHPVTCKIFFNAFVTYHSMLVFYSEGLLPACQCPSWRNTPCH